MSKVWVFRLSELAAAIEQNRTAPTIDERDTILSGSFTLKRPLWVFSADLY